MDTEQNSKIERRWRRFQEHMGYRDEEMDIYRADPKKVKAMEEASRFATHKFVIDILEAHNCGMGYKAGDRFVVDGGGGLIVDQCPPRLCIAAIGAFKPLVDRMWQAFYDGKSEVLHDTVRCPDVGVSRGGWGEITMRIRAVAGEEE
jgi:uncharacterized repeat protein (TIGR04076 family)